ncbi:MAG: hypothetical protein R2762_13110 [Bryobacteraceae bacterium]
MARALMIRPPPLVVHCDWSAAAGKRWLAAAWLLPSGSYAVSAPEPVGDVCTLFPRLRARAPCGTILAGFDFPVGIPRAYASAAGIQCFLDFLSRLGEGAWEHFYVPAAIASQISLTRPFYPHAGGGTRQQHLVDGLGLARAADLLRLCERRTATRNQASSLFWTLGPQQVGKAAIHGWKNLLAPAVFQEGARLWPFDGDLEGLCQGDGIVVAETYPAEVYRHLELERNFGKGRQAGRRSQAKRILSWCAWNGIVLDSGVEAQVEQGFGGAASGEDAFDALIGVLGMVEAVGDAPRRAAPDDDSVRMVEGWILGMDPVEVRRE